MHISNCRWCTFLIDVADLSMDTAKSALFHAVPPLFLDFAKKVVLTSDKQKTGSPRGNKAEPIPGLGQGSTARETQGLGGDLEKTPKTPAEVALAILRENPSRVPPERQAQKGCKATAGASQKMGTRPPREITRPALATPSGCCEARGATGHDSGNLVPEIVDSGTAVRGIG